MTSILVALVVGSLGARLTGLAGRPVFALPGLARHWRNEAEATV